MTRKEFLECIARRASWFYNRDVHGWNFELDLIRNKYHIDVNVDFVHDFLYKGGFKGTLAAWRYEIKSDDQLHFQIDCFPNCIYYWNDIDQYVSMIAKIGNCTCEIEKFFLSENGRFWDENHKLRFQTEEKLLDYLLAVEYDYHPIITEKTYEMLRYFGRYEGRRIDTTDLECELKKYGIMLSQIQLNAISEFGGLTFSFSDSHKDEKFRTIEYMIKKMNEENPHNKLDFDVEIRDPHIDKVIARNVIEIGYNDYCPIAIAEDGKVFSNGSLFARTILEYIYAFGKDIPENVRWL